MQHVCVEWVTIKVQHKCLLYCEHCLVITVLDAIVFFLGTTGVLTLSFILFFHCDYRRLRFEEQIRAENIISSHADEGVISSWLIHGILILYACKYFVALRGIIVILITVFYIPLTCRNSTLTNIYTVPTSPDIWMHSLLLPDSYTCVWKSLMSSYILNPHIFLGKS